MKEIKNIALIGLGALSAFIAPGLLQAYPDHFVVLAKNARKIRIQEEGLTVNGQNWQFPVIDPEETPFTADLIFLVVKYPQLFQALEDIRPAVGPDTILMPLLNGIDSEKDTASVYGMDRVLYALCQVSMTKKGNNIIYNPDAAILRFGEPDNRILSPKVRAVRSVLEKAKIPYEIPEDMIRAQWLKFMYNVSQNQSSAVLGIPFGAWAVSKHANIVREMGMREVIAVAQAMGINLSEDDIAPHREYFKKVPPGNKTSMLQDIEQGRHTEVDQLAGSLIALARQYGISVPLNEFYYHAIKTLEEKADGLF